MIREIILDTETTGLNPQTGDRIVEIGAVEIIDRVITGNTYQQYINPQRDIPQEVVQVHGITNQRVKDEPAFNQIVDEFNNFIKDATVVIHNAPFDVGFINNEYRLCQSSIQDINDICNVVDSLLLAKKKHKGGNNNLDKLCQRYKIDNSHRTLHGALLDSTLLAEVYLKLTSGQATMDMTQKKQLSTSVDFIMDKNVNFKVIYASDDEKQEHNKILASL
jgi:DNA polymerase III subunit epsilon